MVRQHGTEAGQQYDVEKYKKLDKYETMKIDDRTQLHADMKYLFENNIWDLKRKFLEYAEYLKVINVKGEIAWLNNIQ